MSFLAKAALIVAVLMAPAAQVRDGSAVQESSLGAISGRVEVETDRQRGPVRRATVTLTRDDGAVNRTTGTDADGRYRFEGLAAGQYRLRVMKAGFVAGAVDIRTAGVGPGAVPGAVTANIDMQRAGALEGRLIDARGDPIVRVTVIADQLAGPQDAPLPTGTHSAVTDDLGRFRVHTLSPGRYRLSTVPPPWPSDALFYPGTTNPAEARILTVVADQTLNQLDFIVPLRSTSAIAVDESAREAMAAEREALAGGRTARVSGRVTRSDTGQPIPNATVAIMSQSGTTLSTRRLTSTNHDGRFEFAGLSGGSYELSAAAQAFVSENPHGIARAIAVKAGEGVDRADVVLTPASAIEVFVADQFGDPAPGVVLQIAERRYASGVPRFLPIASGVVKAPVTTDDRGWYRASGLFPGDYYLLALPEPFERSGPAGFQTSYFPGAASPDAATPVHIAAGMDALNLRFALVGARASAIAGMATDADGRPVPKTQVVLAQTYDGEVRANTIARTNSGTDGSFVFSEVPEGTYVLQGMAAGLFGSRSVTISREPDLQVRPVALTLKPLTTARGRVVFEGEATPAGPVADAIAFQPTDFTSGPVGSNRIASNTGSDWTFQIPNLAWHGVLRWSLMSAKPTWVLSRVMLQGRDITDVPYDFQSADVSGLEVVVTSRVGSVSGTVVRAGQPVSEAAVMVFGADSTAWTYVSRTLKSGWTNAQGAFTLSGLLPGRYLAVALPVRNSPVDPNSIATLRSLATPFVVSAGTNAPLTLTIIR